jgi:glycyl-tRNA synthetase
MLALLTDAYTEDTVGGEARTLLRLRPALAPYRMAVLPLLKRDDMMQTAALIRDRIAGSAGASVDLDVTASIGTSLCACGSVSRSG